jgi:hypothetical protein
LRALLHGAGGEPASAPGGTVGLGVDGAYAMAGAQQRLERGDREWRRAGEDQIHERKIDRIYRIKQDLQDYELEFSFLVLSC